MKGKRLLHSFILFSMLSCKSTAPTSSSTLWQTESLPGHLSTQALPEQYGSFILNKAHLQTQITTPTDSLQLLLPTPEGGSIMVTLTDSGTLSQELQDKYPEIRSFKGYFMNNQRKKELVRIDINNAGLYAYVEKDNTVFLINPVEKGSSYYISYYERFVHTKTNNPFYEPIRKKQD
jgi:hypothetical protein